MTVRSLLESMDTNEMIHWMKFFQIENEDFEEKHGTEKQQQNVAYVPKTAEEAEDLMMKIYSGK